VSKRDPRRNCRNSFSKMAGIVVSQDQVRRLRRSGVADVVKGLWKIEKQPLGRSIHIEDGIFRRDVPNGQSAHSKAGAHVKLSTALDNQTMAPAQGRCAAVDQDTNAGKPDLAPMRMAGEGKVRAGRDVREPRRIVCQTEGRTRRFHAGQQGMCLRSDDMRVRHADNVDKMAVNCECPPLVIQDHDAMITQRYGHVVLAVDVVVVAEDGKAAMRPIKARHERCNDARSQPAATKILHVYIVPPNRTRSGE
jgi:hypothetical protein